MTAINATHLIEWLTQARLLEEGAAAAIDQRAPALGNHPHLGRLLSANAEESREQAQRLRACLDALAAKQALRAVAGCWKPPRHCCAASPTMTWRKGCWRSTRRNTLKSAPIVF